MTEPDRTTLPLESPAFQGTANRTLRGSEPDWNLIRHPEPPQGAPNVLLVLIDDAGFGNPSTFGGPIPTPNFTRMAEGGVRYHRFHVTALCSPTRAALLTARNNHAVGFGSVGEVSSGFPGYTAMVPLECAPLPRILRDNGYSTAAFGKWHLTPDRQQGPAGPLGRWPTGWGFDYFYGFLGGDSGQWDPCLAENQKIIGTPAEYYDEENPYYLPDAMADKTIEWLHGVRGQDARKPFFVYFSTGCSHAPHHVSNEWADKYKGKFDQGWDKLREETFARQKALGVVPKNCELTRRHPEIPAWDSVDPKMKPVLARQLEVYAGFMEQTDHHVGRLIDALADLKILDDTVVYLIVGDNGASAEGSLQGTFNEMVTLGGFGHLETAESLLPRIDEFGSPKGYNHYAVGWAHAMDTPYQWTKQVASHFGGTRNGTIVHWPKGITGKGEIRTQFHHVIDVAPTILELAGVPQPLMVNGVMQRPIEGVSMAYSFNDAPAAERHETQYFEMFGNRGIYHKGWTAVTKHRTPWETGQVKTIAFNDDVWELYDTSKD